MNKEKNQIGYFSKLTKFDWAKSTGTSSLKLDAESSVKQLANQKRLRTSLFPALFSFRRRLLKASLAPVIGLFWCGA